MSLLFVNITLGDTNLPDGCFPRGEGAPLNMRWPPEDCLRRVRVGVRVAVGNGSSLSPLTLF